MHEPVRQHASIVIDYVAHPGATEALEQRIAKFGDQSIGVNADAPCLREQSAVILGKQSDRNGGSPMGSALVRVAPLPAA